MSKGKSNLVKLFACVFAVCAAFAIATMPKANVVGAASEPSAFEVIGTSIRNGETDGLTGLRFTTKVTEAWLSENQAEKYSFGTLIAPTDKLGEFDSTKNPTENMDLIDGDNIIAVQKQAVSEGFEFTASIIYDEQVVIDYLAEKGSAVTAEEILANLYKKSFTAIPYAMIGDSVIYAEAYSESMYNTALKSLALAIENEDEGLLEISGAYLGISNMDMQSAYVSIEDNTVVVDSVEGFQASEETAIIANGEILVLGEDYTIDAQGNLVLAGELQASATSQQVYVLDNGYLHVVDVLYADKALKSASDVQKFFMASAWDAEDPRITEDGKFINDYVVVLANDVDMGSIVLSNYESVSFRAYFDGRGHVLSNVTVDLEDDNDKSSTSGIFGVMHDSAVVKNVAFDNLKAIDEETNSGIFSSDLRGTVENIYVSYAFDNKHLHGLFLKVGAGILRNAVIVDNYYDDAYTTEQYVSDNINAWGVSPISRLIYNRDAFENIQVVSRRPLLYYSTTTSTDVSYTDPVEDDPSTEDKDETEEAKMKWGTFYAYAENENELWYDFDYFYREVGETEYGFPTGLGLEEGTATVENTLSTGKTYQIAGVRRYDSATEMIADSNNTNNLVNLIMSKMFKLENNELVWAKNENIGKATTVVNSTVEYDASTGELKSTAWNGETILGVTINGVKLTAEENGGLILDENDNIIGIRSKANSTDTLPGIEYRNNRINTNQVIDYAGSLQIETASGIYAINNVEYWTQIIYDVTDLKEALGYNVNYTLVNHGSTVATNATNKGILTLAAIDKSVYYTNNYNVGLYKLAADIDMEKTGIGYTANALSAPTLGGYAALLDGYGYSIKNFAPGTQGLLGAMNSYNRGSQVDEEFGTGQLNTRSIPFNPTIRNIAFEDVITSVTAPVIAVSTGHAQNYTGRSSIIENVYVTISSESTGSVGIVNKVYRSSKTNNVLIVNNNDFGQFIELDGRFKFNDRDGAVTLPESRVFYNPLSTTESRNASLFGLLANSTTTKISGVVGNTTNVFVVSKLPLMHYNGETSKYMYSYTISRDDTNKTANLNLTFLGGYNSSKGEKVRAYGYGANETVGFIPTVYAIKASFLTEFNANYDTLSTNKQLSSNMFGFYCSVCYEPTLAGVDKDAAGSACTMTANCTGTLVKDTSSNGFWNCPAIYEWTLPNLETEAGSSFATSNGTYRFTDAYRYDSVADMKTAECDLSSFTGTDGNGMWNVVEGELVWVGAVA